MRLQIIVTYHDHMIMYYPVSADCGGWKIDAPSRCLVVGVGVPRTWIPLDQVRSFSIERIGGAVDEGCGRD